MMDKYSVVANAIKCFIWNYSELRIQQVIIGSFYLIDCRVEKRVPLFLIVAGIALLPVSVLALFMVRGDKALTGLWKLIATFVCSPLMLFLLAWTIVGETWCSTVNRAPIDEVLYLFSRCRVDILSNPESGHVWHQQLPVLQSCFVHLKRSFSDYDSHSSMYSDLLQRKLLSSWSTSRSKP